MNELENEQSSIENRLSVLEREVNKLKEQFSADTATIQKGTGKKLSAKEFLLTKDVENDVRRTLAIAYFLEHFESMSSFNADDIRTYFRLAKFPVPANVNDKVNLNIKAVYIMEAMEKKDSKKAWTLTASGEKAVESNFNE